MFWCLRWHLWGCEVKMSQGCHTIKGNKRSTVILVAVIKCQCTAEHCAGMQLLSSWQLCQQRWRSHWPAAQEAETPPVVFIISIRALGCESLNLQSICGSCFQPSFVHLNTVAEKKISAVIYDIISGSVLFKCFSMPCISLMNVMNSALVHEPVMEVVKEGDASLLSHLWCEF